jgi:hypothetical protein
MARTWKYALAFGLVGSALAVGCVVKEGDDDATAGQAGEGGTGGSGGTTGGSSGKGGSGGTSGKGGSGGTSGKGGSGTGGSAGTGGSTSGSGGDAGMAGADTGGTSGTGGTGGSGGDETQSVCEVTSDFTDYPDCEPSDATDDCEVCVQEKCCDEYKSCLAYGSGNPQPVNACGYGGPSADMDYSGAGEYGCYTTCMTDYVAENGVCDNDGIDMCASFCAQDCDLVPDATSNIIACVNANCVSQCFRTTETTCGS